MTFSESAKLTIAEMVAWADDEASKATAWLRMAALSRDASSARVFRSTASKHQARARWLYELLAEATVDQQKS